jgi:PAS domain-containing protein
MNLLLLVIILLLLILYILRGRESEKIIQQLVESVDQKRRFLLKESSAKIQFKSLERLVLSVNTLIDDHATSHSETSGFSNQVEATLSSIQEAVFVLNDEHIIEYANESAERIFNLKKADRRQWTRSQLK